MVEFKTVSGHEIGPMARRLYMYAYMTDNLPGLRHLRYFPASVERDSRTLSQGVGIVDWNDPDAYLDHRWVEGDHLILADDVLVIGMAVIQKRNTEVFEMHSRKIADALANYEFDKLSAEIIGTDPQLDPLQKKIVTHLQQHPNTGKNALVKALKKGRTEVFDAVDKLIEGGQIVTSDGANRAVLLSAA